MVDITLLVSRVGTRPDGEGEEDRIRRGDILFVYPRNKVQGKPLAPSRRAVQFYLHVNNVPANSFRRAKRVLERRHDDFPDDDDSNPTRPGEMPTVWGRRRFRLDLSELPAGKRADINRTGEATVNWPTFRDRCDVRAPSRTGFLRKLLDSDMNDRI